MMAIEGWMEIATHWLESLAIELATICDI